MLWALPSAPLPAPLPLHPPACPLPLTQDEVYRLIVNRDAKFTNFLEVWLAAQCYSIWEGSGGWVEGGMHRTGPTATPEPSCAAVCCWLMMQSCVAVQAHPIAVPTTLPALAPNLPAAHAVAAL